LLAAGDRAGVKLWRAVGERFELLVEGGAQAARN
jgi:hypothetical protein